MSSVGAVDKAESCDLTRLAYDLSSSIEKAEHKPGQWAQTAQSMGGICCPGAPFDISKPWAKEEPWANFSFKRDSWLAVAAVNALPKLLALIAENKRLVSDHGNLVLRNKVLRERPDLAADRIRSHDQVIALQAERDQLKADNDRLRNLAQTEIDNAAERAKEVMGARMTLHTLEQERNTLKAEGEALRKDAERYRWLRQDDVEQYQISTKCSEHKMDVAIDAAMSKGKQS